MNVPDSAAHAWVEVYIDGYGWEPVEVTPVYAGSTPAQSGAEEPEATPSPTPTPQASRAPDSAAPTPTPTPSAALPNEGPKLPLRLLPALLAALLLALALPLRRFWARRRRERRFQDENPNRAAIAAYLYLQRLTRWEQNRPPGPGSWPKRPNSAPTPSPPRSGTRCSAPPAPRQRRWTSPSPGGSGSPSAICWGCTEAPFGLTAAGRHFPRPEQGRPLWPPLHFDFTAGRASPGPLCRTPGTSCAFGRDLSSHSTGRPVSGEGLPSSFHFLFVRGVRGHSVARVTPSGQRSPRAGPSCQIHCCRAAPGNPPRRRPAPPAAPRSRRTSSRRRPGCPQC